MKKILHTNMFAYILLAFTILGCIEEENLVNTLPSDLLMAELYLQPTAPSQCDIVTIYANAKNIGTNIAGNFTIEIFNDMNFNSIADTSEIIYSHQYTDLSPNDSILASVIIDSFLVGQLQFISQILYAQDNNVSNNKLIKLLNVYPCLLNSSFEQNGQPSSDEWKITSTLPNNFSNDVPDSGGSFSLVLEAGWVGGFAEIKVPALVQYSNYKLSFWSKYSAFKGSATLLLLRNGTAIKENSVTVNDIVWGNYSVSDTFSVVQGDSIMVQLSGGYAQLLPGETYFDLCKLEAFE
jgi:hypothetical protein